MALWYLAVVENFSQSVGGIHSMAIWLDVVEANQISHRGHMECIPGSQGAMYTFSILTSTVSGVCKCNKSESVSVSALQVSFPSQMGGCTVFQGGCTVFCCGTALTYKLCILLRLDYFHPRNDGFVSCLPSTEHVKNSVLGMCRNNLHNLPCFWQFWLITMTQT